jgi:hypothetical protein
VLAPIAVLGLLAARAEATGGAFVSESSGFGPNTITYDPSTGLRWLDLTESAGYSHTQILAEQQPGGVFDGYHLATKAEVSQLFVDAGIDLNTNSDFVPQNYTPVVALMALVGTLGNDGNCGTGCTFSYDSGYVRGPAPYKNGFPTAGLAWLDNSAPVSQSYPQGLLGRVILGGGTGDSASASNASWLLVPEPGTWAAGAAAALAMAALRATPRRNRFP